VKKSVLWLFYFFGFGFFCNLALGGQEVVYFAKNKGYLELPAKSTRFPVPGIILIHEWWGLNKNIKDFAKKFSELGYVVLAVDLYDGKHTKDPSQARKLAQGVSQNIPRALKNLRAGVAFLEKHSRVDSKRLASVGWCFGGGWSYQMAKNAIGVKASVVYYGRFNPLDDLKKMKATILGHFGEKDRAIRVSDVKAFQATLKTLKGEHEIYIYPNAGHAFANSDNPNYEPKVAGMAWQRTRIFLRKFL